MKWTLLAPLFLLTACHQGQPQQTALAACTSNAAVISILADARSAGKLSPSQIALVDKDIQITDPLCSSDLSNASISSAAAQAFGELSALALQVK